MPGSLKWTWPSKSPGRICLPLTSISSLPWGRESSVPMATIFSLLIATPPLNVASGVTTQPFLITKSAAILLSLLFLLLILIFGRYRLEPAYRLPVFEVGHDILLAGLYMAAQDR